jgi:hypothetical protein
MKLTTILTRLSLALGAGLVFTSMTASAQQNVIVSGSLTYTGPTAGVYDYTLTMSAFGSQSVESLWLGWALDSNPVFNVLNPSNVGNSLGWQNIIDGNSVMYAGTTGTALAPGHSATFTFDSTSTPTQFENPATSGGSGKSVAYGTAAQQFGIFDTTPNSFDFAPTVVTTPEPSTLGLLAIGSLGLLKGFGRKFRSQ